QGLAGRHDDDGSRRRQVREPAAVEVEAAVGDHAVRQDATLSRLDIEPERGRRTAGAGDERDLSRGDPDLPGNRVGRQEVWTRIGDRRPRDAAVATAGR